MERFKRTELLLGSDSFEKLKNKSVIIFGIGGVGSFAAEAIARIGLGSIAIVDNDVVSESNINRQLIALTSTIGKHKVDVMEKRIKEINPDCNVTAYKCFYTENKEIDISGYDFIIDAIDTVSSKLTLICEANRLNVPIISCMGTGNKLDPAGFKIADIYKTSVCPLARVMRYELKKRGIKKLSVLYSDEKPVKVLSETSETNRHIPASVSFVPPVAGMMIAGEVIKRLIK